MTAALNGVAEKLDHKLLNEIDGLSVPTLERICLWVARELKAELPGLSRVSLSRPSLNENCTLELSV